MECEVCRKERDARCRVVWQEEDPRFQQAPFDDAPYIHPHNIPKYAAIQHRATLFARLRSRCIHWVVAEDQPLHRDDQALSEDALNEKRSRWLTYQDQRTAGMMGLLPLVLGLPVRLTETVNRGLKLFKHRRGTVAGWTLHPDESSEVEGGERRLQHQPLCIYVKFEGGEWQISDLEPGVYPLQPSSRPWLLSEGTKMKAKRTGFFIVPDFSGTAHMYQGSTEKAVIADCLMAGHVSQLVGARFPFRAPSLPPHPHQKGKVIQIYISITFIKLSGVLGQGTSF